MLDRKTINVSIFLTAGVARYRKFAATFNILHGNLSLFLNQRRLLDQSQTTFGLVRETFSIFESARQQLPVTQTE